MAKEMTSKEYLERIKKADNKWFRDYDLTFDELVLNVKNDNCRKLRALEIIAETLIDIKEVITNALSDEETMEDI
jgi:hypothetical protein